MDELDYISEEGLEELNGYAAYLYEQTGVGIFFVYTTTAPLADYDLETLTAGTADYVVMLENEENWNYFTQGKGDSVDMDALREAYDNTETWKDGVGAYLEAAGQCFPVVEAPAADAELAVYDTAGLLTDGQILSLNEKLIKIAQTYNTQLLVCTTETLDDYSDIDSYADELYTYMDFGYGPEEAGVMVLLCKDPRKVTVFSNGILSADDRTAIREAITPELSDDNYVDAFDTFADQCQYYLAFNFGKTLIICLIIGVIAGLIVAFVLKGQLKSVRSQERANMYVKPGSMQLTTQNDFFLYHTVTRTRKASQNNSGSSPSRGSSSGSY